MPYNTRSKGKSTRKRNAEEEAGNVGGRTNETPRKNSAARRAKPAKSPLSYVSRLRPRKKRKEGVDKQEEQNVDQALSDSGDVQISLFDSSESIEAIELASTGGDERKEARVDVAMYPVEIYSSAYPSQEEETVIEVAASRPNTLRSNTVLVYPFANASGIESLSEDLFCDIEFISLPGKDKGSKLPMFSENRPVTIYQSDYERLVDPNEYLSDSNMDFWMRW